MRGRIATMIALACAGCLAVSCADEPPRTSLEVKRYYAQRITQGIDFGLSGRLKAERYDPASLELFDVQLDETSDRILHARRGEIIVNPGRDTVLIRLHDVVAADAATGEMIELAGVSTDEMQLGFDVRP